MGDAYVGIWVESGPKPIVFPVKEGKETVAMLGVKLGGEISPFGEAGMPESKEEVSSGSSWVPEGLGLKPGVLSGG